MLFWLHSSLADAVEDNTRSEAVCNAIIQVVESQIKGNHIYTADRQTLSKLIAKGDFNVRVRQHLIKTLNSLSQQMIYRSFKVYTEICWGNNLREAVDQDGKLVLRISVDIVLQTRITERSFLLCENLRDIEFYRKIVDVVRYEKNILDRLLISPDAVGGGGSTIAQQYDLWQKEDQKFCLCILDTDWKYEGASLGPTAARLVQVHNTNISSDRQRIFCNYVLIPSREVENLIPTPLLRQITTRNSARDKFLSWFELFEHKHPEARFFVDIKGGLLFKSIVLERNEKRIEYWYSQLDEWLTKCNYRTLRNCDRGCACFEIPGMGSSTLEHVLDAMAKYSPRELDAIVKEYPWIMEPWFDLGERILYWFAGTPPAYLS